MEKEKLPYKINIGQIYKVKRKDITKGDNQYTFFSIPVKKKNKDGEYVDGEKTVRLIGGENVEDGQSIKILDMFEDFYKKDYATLFTLVITKFEVIEPQEKEKEVNVYAEALDEYEKELGGGLEEW